MGACAGWALRSPQGSALLCEGRVPQLFPEDSKLFPVFQCQFGDFPSDVGLCYLQQVLLSFLSELRAVGSVGANVPCAGPARLLQQRWMVSSENQTAAESPSNCHA